MPDDRSTLSPFSHVTVQGRSAYSGQVHTAGAVSVKIHLLSHLTFYIVSKLVFGCHSISISLPHSGRATFRTSTTPSF